MAVLVAISIIEVAVYAYLINPGHDQAFYDAHAQVSAPYISGIFGFIVCFLVARYWKKKGYESAFRLAMLFPLIYVLIDVAILFAARVNWADFYLVFLLANAAKFLASYLGYTLTKTSQKTSV